MMTKPELIAAISDKAGISPSKAKAALNAFIAAVMEELANGGEVRLIGFGSFEVAERAPRIGRNLQTGAEIEIPGSNAVRFKAGKGLKAALR